jgi:hypothetical protein
MSSRGEAVVSGADLLVRALRFFGPIVAWALARAPKEMLLREAWMSSLASESSSSEEALSLLSESLSGFDSLPSDPSSCDCSERTC